MQTKIMSLAWLFAIVSMAGCAGQEVFLSEDQLAQQRATQAEGYSPLWDTKWTLSSLDGHELIAGSTILLNFGQGKLWGHSGCNTYRYVGDVFQVSGGAHFYAGGIGEIAIPMYMETSARGCAEPIMDQEEEYLTVFSMSYQYVVTDEELKLIDIQGSERLVYAKR